MDQITFFQETKRKQIMSIFLKHQNCSVYATLSNLKIDNFSYKLNFFNKAETRQVSVTNCMYPTYSYVRTVQIFKGKQMQMKMFYLLVQVTQCRCQSLKVVLFGFKSSNEYSIVFCLFSHCLWFKMFWLISKDYNFGCHLCLRDGMIT